MAISANEVFIAIKAQDQASKVIGGITGKLKSIGPVALGAAGALAGVGFVVADFIKAAADEEKGIARLQTAIGNLDAAHKGSAAQVEALVSQREKLAYADDEIRDSLSLLVAQTGDYTEAARRQAIAMDLARGTGIDLGTASKLLGKVTDETTSVLSRYGIVIREGADAQEVLATVQAKFGGQAEAYAGTAAGAWERFTNQIDNLKETFGAALLPAVTKVGGELADFLSTHQADIQRLVERVSALVGEGFQRLSQWFQRHGPEIREGLASFAKLIGDLKAAWDKIAPIVQTVFLIWQNEIATKLKVIKDIIDVFTAVLAGDWGKAWDSIKRLVLDVFEGLKRDLELKLRLLGQVFGGFVENILTTLSNLPGQMLGLVSSWLSAARSLGDALWQGLLEGLKQAPGMVGAFLTGIWDAIKGLINQAIDAVNNAIPNSISKFGIGIDLPDNPIPRLARGLPYVPRNTLAFLHQGEAVLSQIQAQRYRRGQIAIPARAGGDTIINDNRQVQTYMTIQGLPEDVVKQVGEALETALRRAGFGGSFVTSGAFAPY